MEQQTQQGRERQRPEEQHTARTRERNPERERLSGPGQLAQALMAGVSLLDLPPLRLEELAALMGNQGMADLLEQQSIPLEETRFTLPEPVGTTPWPVPETELILSDPPPDLTAGEQGGRAFDPAGLVY